MVVCTGDALLSCERRYLQGHVSRVRYCASVHAQVSGICIPAGGASDSLEEDQVEVLKMAITAVQTPTVLNYSDIQFATRAGGKAVMLGQGSYGKVGSVVCV
jgi:hypothetical protein